MHTPTHILTPCDSPWVSCLEVYSSHGVEGVIWGVVCVFVYACARVVLCVCSREMRKMLHLPIHRCWTELSSFLPPPPPLLQLVWCTKERSNRARAEKKRTLGGRSALLSLLSVCPRCCLCSLSPSLCLAIHTLSLRSSFESSLSLSTLPLSLTKNF